MNGKPGTKAECDALEAAAAYLGTLGMPYARLLGTLHEKLTAPFKPRAVGPDPLAIQEALGGGVTKVQAGEAWWAGMSRKLAAVNATVEDARVIGRWLQGQPWAKDFTIDRVVNGWPSYLVRARKGTSEPQVGWSRPEFGDPR